MRGRQSDAKQIHARNVKGAERGRRKVERKEKLTEVEYRQEG